MPHYHPFDFKGLLLSFSSARDVRCVAVVGMEWPIHPRIVANPKVKFSACGNKWLPGFYVHSVPKFESTFDKHLRTIEVNPDQNRENKRMEVSLE